VSTWPTILLRLLATALGVFSIYQGWQRLRRNSDELGEDYFGLSSSAKDIATREAEAVVLKDGEQRPTWWERHAHWVIDALSGATWGWQPDPRNSADAAQIWDSYREHERASRRLTRAAMLAAAFGSVAWVAFWLDPAVIPSRGEFSLRVNGVVLGVSVTAQLLLLFFVVDAMRSCAKLVQCFARTESIRFDPKLFVDENLPKLDDFSYRDRLRALRLLARRTRAVGDLAYYPAVVMLIMMIARHSVFANWQWTLSLVFVFAASATILVSAALVLWRSANTFRETILDAFHSSKLRAKLRGQTDVDSRIDTVIDEIHGMAQGAFSGPLGQPLARALLIPVGGFGFLQLVELMTGVPTPG